jgi:hypothetical protein
MPKNFSAEEVSKEIGLEKEYEENKHLFKQEKLTIYPKESILVNVGLWILSGSIFGLIWRYLILSSVNKFNEIKNKNLHFILSILVLPYYGVLSYKVNKRIVKEFKSKGVNCVDLSVLYLIIGLFGLGVVSSIIMQYHLNKLLKYIDE